MCESVHQHGLPSLCNQPSVLKRSSVRPGRQWVYYGRRSFVAGDVLMARCHILWRKIHTPFISVFNRYRKALDWAEMLEQKGCAHISIVVIDTFTVPQGKLWNAHQIATDLGFLDERVRFHEHEYLFYGSIEHERILAVLPAKGPRIPVSVHLGTLTLAQLCFEAIGSQDIDAVKAYLREEICWRCGRKDEASLQQTMLALCTARWD